ncbi:hypothetical protein [Eleftheria terrae]|uniref:hypothetical protein n=1 Tax=Eleftheria terrae TaxID=1597781 RepID=UPI00343C99AC
MNHITTTDTALPGCHVTELSALPAIAALTVAELAAMPAVHKADVQRQLQDAAAWLRQAEQKLAAALDAAYGATSRQALRDSGRDFGTVNGRDGSVQITFELPKRVKWDQQQLHQLAERIVAGGEKVEHYIDAKLSVSETKFKSWPPSLQEQFAPARAVEPGKASITLHLDAKEAN